MGKEDNVSPKINVERNALVVTAVRTAGYVLAVLCQKDTQAIAYSEVV